MKFYTKSWYELMQRLDYVLGMQPVPDKKYTDREITDMCSAKLKELIERDKKDYDTPPEQPEPDVSEDELEDYVFFDAQKGVLVKPESVEDVKKRMREQYEKMLENFNSRPPFDPAETVNQFTLMYKNGVKYGYDRYPDWVRKQTDVRLIALGYLPESVYNRLEQESKDNKLMFDTINEKAQKVLAEQQIPEEISNNFNFHDAEILCLELKDNCLKILLCECFTPFENQTPYTAVIFKDAKVIENQSFEIKKDGEGDAKSASSANNRGVWLYDEIYSTQEGYEVHILAERDGLKYLTIACTDIAFEFNLEYPAAK